MIALELNVFQISALPNRSQQIAWAQPVIRKKRFSKNFADQSLRALTLKLRLCL